MWYMAQSSRKLFPCTIFWPNKQIQNNCDNCNKNSSVTMKTSLFLKNFWKIIATRIATNCDNPMEIATHIMKSWQKVESIQLYIQTISLWYSFLLFTDNLLMLAIFGLNKQLEKNCDNCNKNSSVTMKTSKNFWKIIATTIVTNCDKQTNAK